METPFEHILVSCHKQQMLVYLSEHPDCFEEAIQLLLSDKQPYAWRAAWLMRDAMAHNDERLQAHLPQLIGKLSGFKDGHQREVLALLYQMDISAEFEGLLFDQCAHIWEQIHKQPALRCYAFKMMLKIMAHYPEFEKEIAYFAQEQYMDSLSPGIKNSMQKLLKRAL
jgi:hypothetical protein